MYMAQISNTYVRLHILPSTRSATKIAHDFLHAGLTA